MTLELEIAALSDVGTRHTRNEDCVAIGAFVLSSELPSAVAFNMSIEPPFTLAVLDGMGGHRGGQHASSSAAAELIRHSAALTNRAAVADAIELANRRLYGEMDTDTLGMGSTVVLLVVHSDRVIVANVGDSSCFMDAMGYLVQLTVDDRHAGTGRLTQSLGGLAQYVPVEPHVVEDEWVDRRILLMSDGIAAAVSVEEMERCLDASNIVTAQRLLEAARRNGSTDDASVVVVRIAHGSDPLVPGSVPVLPDPTLPIPTLPAPTFPGGSRLESP